MAVAMTVCATIPRLAFSGVPQSRANPVGEKAAITRRPSGCSPSETELRKLTKQLRVGNSDEDFIKALDNAVLGNNIRFDFRTGTVDVLRSDALLILLSFPYPRYR